MSDSAASGDNFVMLHGIRHQGSCPAVDARPCTCGVRTTAQRGPLMTVDEIDRRMSEVLSWLAQSGMKHDTFDSVYTPLLALRDRLVPGKYS